MIGARIKELVHGFLDRNGKKREDIKGWILHPGGARLLGTVEQELGLCKCDTQPSWDILGETLATFPAPRSSLFFRSGWKSAP